MMVLNPFLRPYQREQVESVVTNRKAGHNRLVVGSAVGTGKSVTIGELCRLGRKPLVIAPNLNLLWQMHSGLAKYLDEDIDIEQGSRKVSNSGMHRSRVVLASRASLLSNDRYKKFPDRTVILRDECHLANTEKQKQIDEWFESNGATVVGLTATPFKADGSRMDYWNDPCWYRSLPDFIRDGWLARIKVTHIEPKEFDWTFFDENEFTENNIDTLMSEESTSQEIVNAVLQLSKGQQCAVYCAGRKSMWRTREVFERFGLKVSCVWGTQPIEDRLINMEAFKTGATRVILNVGVLAYGWDYPELRYIFSAAPTRSLTTIEQRLGRLTRTLPGVLDKDMNQEERLAAIANSEKPFGHFYDLTTTMSGFHLASAVEVFDRRCRGDEERKKRIVKNLGDDGDIIDTVEETVKDIEQEQRAAEERRKAMLGIHFDKHDLNIETAKEEKVRGWRMFYGPFRGKLMREVPTGVLRSHLRKSKPGQAYTKALATEIQRRGA